ncbi:MAG TPA: LysM peptidoglycan-binding domain-containing protein [Candidatus Hydrogenedentes bacterium]|nr:LysM peptidoglycan-binding domain-containing protein [Candidatus Hydrogenedentota bacterium]
METAPYTVRPGDTLLGIAARHGATRDRVMALNGLSDPDHIRVGQVLRVPK